MDKKKNDKIKKVLWCTDFSRESRNCLPYLKFFSDKLKTDNYAAYVLPKFSDWVYEAAFFSNDDLEDEIIKSREISLKKLEKISKDKDLKLKSEILEGIASEELIRFSEAKESDLIIAGRRGISEIEQILIGSTTSRLIRNSKKPVLVVPCLKRKVDIKKILVPIDFNEDSMEELKFAISLAKSVRASISIIHVSEFFNYRVPVLKLNDLTEKINKKILDYAESLDYTIDEIIYETGEPAHKIMETSKKIKADLITMTTSQKRGLSKLFLGSITEKVLMYSKKPVLVIPLEEYENRQ